MEEITISKKEYEILVKCRKIVDSEFEERFSKKFIEDVKKSEEEYRKGNFVKFKNIKEAKKYFDAM